ncbi:ABC transporter permease [Roseivivax isoporae]|uniref:Transport permease protein n=1 Tax=Roseivivax isoporae LMG 25204 TaxID=1449351 RepID=X7F4L0_9RHOB|nr:ABC transporter permease [Roseivivax isoporae]ETX26994.1 sugar ABC transporter permease [Roseivivax isoporae LMG 25204]
MASLVSSHGSRPPRAIVRAVGALMLREMSTSFGRVSGGYLWALLQPIGGVAIMTLVFSFAFRNPPIGNNFALFYATGLVPLGMYQDINQKLATALRFSRPLLAYPSVTFMDALIGRVLLNALTQALVFFIVFTGIMLFTDARAVIDMTAIMRAFLMLLALSLGVGVTNCFLQGVFPVWQQIWSILNRPLFIISGIFFVIDYMPRYARELLLWNPVAHPIMEMRAGFFPTYEAVYVSEVYVYGVAGSLSVFGLLMLYRYHDWLLNERM